MPQIMANGPFKVLVANLSGYYDAQGNPIKLRTGFLEQIASFLPSEGFGNQVMGSVDVSAGFTPSTGTVTVIDNDFSTGDAILTVDRYVLIAGVQFAVGGGPAATATNLAAAISNLPGYSASVLGAAVTILGPAGLDGNPITFTIQYTGTKTNYALLPTQGYLTPGTPQLVGPVPLP